MAMFLTRWCAWAKSLGNQPALRWRRAVRQRTSCREVWRPQLQELEPRVLMAGSRVSFAAHSDFRVGSAPVAVAVADVNRDGHPDLVVANRDSSTVSVLLGNGNGTFQS